MVSLQKDGVHFCGGVLITDQLVATAAHCLFLDGSQVTRQPEEITVVVGAYNLDKVAAHQSLHVRSLRTHPSYRPGERNPCPDCDIAVIRLRNPVPQRLRDHVDVIRRPVEAYELGLTVHALGWGKTNGDSDAFSPTLKIVQLSVLSHAECQERHLRGYVVTDSVLCTDSSNGDICQGDSGGPLISTALLPSGLVVDTLVGITSLSSVSRTSTQRCGVNGSASIFTRVQTFSDFLETEIECVTDQSSVAMTLPNGATDTDPGELEVPSWFANNVQFCHNYMGDNVLLGSNRLISPKCNHDSSGTGLSCASPNHFTKDYYEYRKDGFRRLRGCYSKWHLSVPNDTDVLPGVTLPAALAATQLCQRFKASDVATTHCGGRPVNQTTCVKVNQSTPRYYADRKARAAGCTVSWMISTPGGLPIPRWMGRLKLCMTWRQNCVKPAGPICAGINQWTEQYTHDRGSRKEDCSVKWSLSF